jgi:hypothetical protein
MGETVKEVPPVVMEVSRVVLPDAYIKTAHAETF